MSNFTSMEKQREIHNITPESHNIEGTYGDGIIQVNTFKIENNPNVTINIHGTFGSMNGGSGNTEISLKPSRQPRHPMWYFMNLLVNKQIDPTTTDRYKQKQAKFIGKTFSDELERYRRVLRDTIENSSSLF